MRTFATLLIAAFSTCILAQSSVTLNVSRNGKHVGTATFTVQIDSNGALVQRQLLSLNAGNTSIKITEVGRDDRTGFPQLRRVHVEGAGQVADVTITFTKSGAKVNAKGPTGSKSKTVPAPSGANLHIGSDFWFIRDHPPVGTTVQYVQLDVNTLQWRQEKDTYVGDRTITVAGHKVKAHKIATRSGSQWVDDKSLPYRVEQKEGASNIVMVRG